MKTMVSLLISRKGYKAFLHLLTLTAVLFSLSVATMVSAEPLQGQDASVAHESPNAVDGHPVLPPIEAPKAVGAAPHGFSPIALYHQADVVGKSVILLLIFSSFLSWTLWLGKAWEVSRYRRRLTQSITVLCGDVTIGIDSHSLASPACVEMLKLAQAELKKGLLHSPQTVTHVQDRVHARIQRVEAAEARVLTRGAGVLATTSAVAPFVGLFGTVWGIMHSFISIANAQSTNLSVVAPGIAEALFATALGLLVAVPAVLFYNIIARYISGYRQLLADASTLIQCLLSQELDARASVSSRKELDRVA